nr:hypothetical protein [Tanacetum cinerariifolium]
MKTFLVGHKVLADEVVKLKNGEGTSHNGQDSIDHHSGNQHQSGGGVGNTYKKGNHSYGRLAKIEFPKAVMILKVYDLVLEHSPPQDYKPEMLVLQVMMMNSTLVLLLESSLSEILENCRSSYGCTSLNKIPLVRHKTISVFAFFNLSRRLLKNRLVISTIVFLLWCSYGLEFSLNEIKMLPPFQMTPGFALIPLIG